MANAYNFAIAGLIFACAALTSAARLSGQSPAAAKPDPKTLTNPIPSTPQSIAAGRTTFMTNCTICHGPEAKGDGPSPPPGAHPADLTDDQWDNGGTDGEIFTTIHDGVRPKLDMAAWGKTGKLTDQEIWNLVNYIHSIGPKPKGQ
jgi:mono/diheme cytochrome c family protein